MNQITKYISYYIFFILVFGLFYYTYWFFHPDSFIIEDQFNLHPFSSDAILGHQINNLNTYQFKADSLRTLNLDNQSKLIHFTKNKDSLKVVLDVIHEKNEKIRWQKIELWREKQIPDSLNKKKYYLDSLIKNSNNAITIANLNVQRSKLEYEISKIDLRSSEYILGHLQYFADTVVTKQLLHIDSLYYVYDLDSIPNASTSIYRTEYEISQLKYNALSYYRKRVSCIDFLLFSASNSSTVTYGEFIPNDFIVRFALFSQAIICIIIIGFATDSLINKNK